MLTIPVNDKDKIINNLVLSEDYSSDRDFYNNKLLNLTSNNVINNITDTEVVEFKPERTQVINFNLFFLRYLQTEDYSKILPYIESNFTEHYKNTKIELGLLNANGTTPDVAYNSYLDIRQDNLLRAPAQEADLNKLNKSVLKDSGLAVFNEAIQANLKKPVKAGIPVFYNSFTIPFWDNNKDWKDSALLYKNKPYFYNSLLLMEVFDSPDNIKQQRLISIPVFVNQRYNLNEKPSDYGILVERPCFQLTNGCDGFSLFFLNLSLYTNLYVKFSFWDALNAKKITLIPSSATEPDKKWFQKSSTFKQESLYLKYTLDYSKKTYRMTEYDYTTNRYDLIRTNFDLYEFAFDQYFEGFNVVNKKPVDATLPQPVTPPLNPFKFTINNVIRDLYYNVDSSNINANIFNLNYNESGTFLGGTGGLVKVYNDYINSIYGRNITFFCFNQNTITIPVINKTYKGYSNDILDFKIRNIDTVSWKISTIDFVDMVLGLDNSIISGKTATNTIYKDQILCESLTVVDNSVLDTEINSFLKPPDTVNIETPNTVWALSKNLFFEFDVLELIITDENSFVDTYTTGCIEYDKYGNCLNTDSVFNGSRPDYSLNNLMNLLGYRYNASDTSHDVKTYLINTYNDIKKFDPVKYKIIVGEITQILQNDVRDLYRTSVLKYVNDHFTASNYPTYITSYLNLVYKNNNDFNLADAKILSELDPEFVKLKANEGFTLLDGFFADYKDLSLFFSGRSKYTGTEDNLKTFDVRDYIFDTILTVTGNKNVAVNGELSFSLKYHVGYKILQATLNTKKITIKGKIKMGIEHENNIKYIFVPINVTLNVGDRPTQTYLSEITPTTSQLKI
jgi:hypothetical protein